MLAQETWAPLLSSREVDDTKPLNVTSSAVDLFVQLDRLVEVYTRLAKLLPLPQQTHSLVVSMLGGLVVRYVEQVVGGCAPRPPSRLEAVARVGPPKPCPRSNALDGQGLRELCSRLNACEWAGQQLLQLTNRLRGEVPGVTHLPGVSESVRRCESCCDDLLKYTQEKL